jgi:hypothetical protein
MVTLVVLIEIVKVLIHQVFNIISISVNNYKIILIHPKNRRFCSPEFFLTLIFQQFNNEHHYYCLRFYHDYNHLSNATSAKLIKFKKLNTYKSSTLITVLDTYHSLMMKSRKFLEIYRSCRTLFTFSWLLRT